MYSLAAADLLIEETLRFDPQKGKIALAVGFPYEGQGLLLKAQEWMDPVSFLCEHNILQMTAGLITQLTGLLGMSLGRLSHKERVRKLLEKYNCSDDYIQQVMDQLPDPKPRTKKKDEDLSFAGNPKP